jgi:PhzF family phenazine biosynthesis protein
MAALEALGIDPGDLDPSCPSVVAGVGGSRVLLAVRSGATLARLRPDLPRLAGLSAGGMPAGYFVYSLAPTLADCDSEARMFCPALGIMEDPVSGNAHAMLAAQLQTLGRLPAHSGYVGFAGRQGHHMGRPGALTVRLANNAEGLKQIGVAGNARVVFDATLEL